MNRVVQLDGVRGIAILMVFLCHFFQNEMHHLRSPVQVFISKALSLTWSGVDLFFVLSGFLVCGILIDNRDSPQLFKAFYVRRAVRILPLYCLSLALFLICMGQLSAPLLFDNPMPLWSYLTFTQNYTMAAFGEGVAEWMGVTWSLAVEEQFYLVVPWVVFLVPPRALMGVFIAGIVGAVSLRFMFPGPWCYFLTPTRMDPLLAGGMLALLLRNKSFREWVPRNRKLILGAFFVFLAGAAVMTAKPWSEWAHNYLWLGGMFTLFLLIAIMDLIPPLTKLLCAPPLIWMGKVSYGLYLIHPPVNGLLHWYILRRDPQIRGSVDLAVTLLAIGVTFALAELSFRYFEQPLLKLGHRFKYSDPSIKDVTPSPETASLGSPHG